MLYKIGKLSNAASKIHNFGCGMRETNVRIMTKYRPMIYFLFTNKKV